MRLEELMLRDYVQVNGEACKVISISYFDIGISDSKEDFYHEHIDNIKPIPLTPEILEKNFPVPDFVYWEENKGSELYHIHIERCFQEFNGFLKYVHELQHALRLCGIDKEIEV